MESTRNSSDDKEEALSLRDLPLESQFQPRNDETQAIKTDEDFNFVSLPDSLSTHPQMCSADQLFFKGQILPLCVPSESMDHGSFSRFTVSNTNSKAINFRNKFNIDPSSKPQISKTRPIRNETPSMWGFFRFGLVRAPELELHDLKVRKNSVSRKSKLVNNNNGGQVSKGFLEKRIMGRYSGCKCSVNVVETVPLNNIVFIKSNKNNEKKKAILLSAMEEKKKMMKEKEKGKSKARRKASFFTSFNG